MPAVRETTAGDELFRLPLSEFTAARNALAAKLKKAGDSEESDRIKALSKPPVSAWVANQLYWKHRVAFDRLLGAGEQFRNAQAAQLAGKSADLRGPLDARREALGEVTKLAAEVLREAGHPSSPEVMRRIMTTLEAVATYGTHPGAPAAGRLTADIDPPGFEVLAALVPGGSHRPGTAKGHAAPRVIPFNQPKPRQGARKAADDREDSRRAEQARRERQNEARKALQEAERALVETRRAAERARAEMKEAAARAKTAEKDKAALEARLEKLSAAAETARQAARQVASRAEEAAQAVDDAERAVAAAREQLREVES